MKPLAMTNPKKKMKAIINKIIDQYLPGVGGVVGPDAELSALEKLLSSENFMRLAAENELTEARTPQGWRQNQVHFRVMLGIWSRILDKAMPSASIISLWLFRDYRLQKRIAEENPGATGVSNPWASNHLQGAAFDFMILNKESGKEVERGTTAKPGALYERAGKLWVKLSPKRHKWGGVWNDPYDPGHIERPPLMWKVNLGKYATQRPK
jgi:hypothetical protein